MPDSNIQSAVSNIATAQSHIRQAREAIHDIVSWVDADTKNVVFGTRAEFLAERSI